MSKLKSLFTILCIGVSFFFISSAQAYIIYNKTPYRLKVVDAGGWTGLVKYIDPNGSASCDPSSNGCAGDIRFQVYIDRANGRDLICVRRDNIPYKEWEHIFIIHPTDPNDHEYPHKIGWCSIDHYRQ